MSKKAYPKSNLATKANQTVKPDLDDLLYSKPKAEIEAEAAQSEKLKVKTPDIEKLTLKGSEEIGKKLEKILETNENLQKPTEKFEAKVKPNVRIYFDENNYSRFEDMYDEIKKQVRQKTGVKLKETGISELSIMLIVEEFEKDPDKVLQRILKIMPKK